MAKVAIANNIQPIKTALPGQPVPLPPNFYNYPNLNPNWNPSLPPPTIIPTQGVNPAPANFQFPGGIMGATWDDVQDLIRKQKKTKGMLCVTTALRRNIFPVLLSGTARIFMGLALSNSSGLLSSFSTKVSLFINNEQVITDVSPYFLTLNFSNNCAPIDYYSFPRPLSGTDDINLIIDEPAASTATYQFTFYYL